jgi:hypothetical protein
VGALSSESMSPDRLRDLGRAEKVAKSYYGSRVPMFSSGKKPSEMVFFNTPKRYYSPNKQIEDLQSYNQNRSDKRTVYIATAQKKEKTIEITLNQETYEIMLSSRDEKDYYKRMKKESTVGSFLEFDQELIPPYIENLHEKKTDIIKDGYLVFNLHTIENQEHLNWILERMEEDLFNSFSPEAAYRNFIVNGSSLDKKLAWKYGDIREFIKYKVETTTTTMPHWFQTYEVASNETKSRYGGKEDCYLGASTLIKFARQAQFVAEMSLLYVDIDYYNVSEYKNLKQTEVINLCLKALDDEGIPRPTNAEISRGFSLKWKTSPIGYHRRSQWLELQELIFKTLEKFGADYSVTKDVVRLSRLVGTYHSKTHKMVYGLKYSDDRYNFDNLFETMLPERWEQILKSREIAKELANKKYQVIDGGKERNEAKNGEKIILDGKLTPNHIKQNYKHIHFIRGLEELISIREGYMTGYRETSIFLYRYWWLCLTGNKIKALNKAKNLYYAMNIEGVYSWEEIELFTSSAENAWEKWIKNSSKGYNYKPSTLIKLLGITMEEQYHVHYLRSEKVQIERKKEIDRKNKKASYEEDYAAKREKKGKISREEQKTLRMTKINDYLAENPEASIREIAAGTDLSKSVVQRLLKGNI